MTKAPDPRERALGHDRPNCRGRAYTALTMDVLSDALSAIKLDELGIPFEIFEKAGAEVGTPHQHYTTALSNLASVLSRTGRSAEAETLYDRAIAMDEIRHGSDHPSVALWLVRRVEIMTSTGRAAEGLPLVVRSVQIMETALEGKNPYKDLARTVFIGVLQQLESEGVQPHGHEPAIQLIRSALAAEGAAE